MTESPVTVAPAIPAALKFAAAAWPICNNWTAGIALIVPPKGMMPGTGPPPITKPASLPELTLTLEVTPGSGGLEGDEAGGLGGGEGGGPVGPTSRATTRRAAAMGSTGGSSGSGGITGTDNCVGSFRSTTPSSVLPCPDETALVELVTTRATPSPHPLIALLLLARPSTLQFGAVTLGCQAFDAGTTKARSRSLPSRRLHPLLACSFVIILNFR
jgi:hypothetical protein